MSSSTAHEGSAPLPDEAAVAEMRQEAELSPGTFQNILAAARAIATGSEELTNGAGVRWVKSDFTAEDGTRQLTADTHVYGLKGELTESLRATVTDADSAARDRETGRILLQTYQAGARPDDQFATAMAEVNFANGTVSYRVDIGTDKEEAETRQALASWGVRPKAMEGRSADRLAYGGTFDEHDGVVFAGALQRYRDRLDTQPAKIQAEWEAPEHPDIPAPSPDKGYGYADLFNIDKALEAATRGEVYIEDLSAAHLLFALRRHTEPHEDTSFERDATAYLEQVMVNKDMIKTPDDPVVQLHKRLVFTVRHVLGVHAAKNPLPSAGEDAKHEGSGQFTAGRDEPDDYKDPIRYSSSADPDIKVSTRWYEPPTSRPATREDFENKGEAVPDNLADYTIKGRGASVPILEIAINGWGGTPMAVFLKAELDNFDSDQLTGFNPIAKPSNSRGMFGPWSNSSGNTSSFSWLPHTDLVDAVEATRAGRQTI